MLSENKKLYISVVFATLVVLVLQTVLSANAQSGFTYTVGQTVTIDRYNGGGSAVTIPESIDGKAVTSIGSYAFDRCISVQTLVLPSGLETIGEGAFRACKVLSLLVIPKNVTSIGYYAFDLCENLTLSCYAGSAAHDYALRYKIKFVLIDSGTDEADYEYTTTSTEATLLRYRGNSSNVSIPKTLGGRPVMIIADGAFAGNIYITSVEFPETVTTVGAGAFADCQRLVSFSLNSNNRYFAVENGVLYSADKAVLVAYPSGLWQSEYTVPSFVSSVANGAFRGTAALKTVNLPSSVSSVGYYAFADCESLENINISNPYCVLGADICKNTPWLAAKENGLVYCGSILYGCKGSVSGKIVVNGGTTSVAAYSFAKMNVTSVDLPESVKVAGGYVFNGTEALQSLIVRTTSLKIGDYFVSSAPVVYCAAETEASSLFAANGNRVEPLPLSGPPHIFALYVSNSVIAVSWAEVSGASAYNVYLNNKLVGTTLNASYSYKGLAPSQSYELYVTAVAGSEESAKSNILSLSTISYIPGDVDGSGDVELVDAVKVFMRVAGKLLLENEKLADMNADESIDIADAIILFQVVAGKISV